MAKVQYRNLSFMLRIFGHNLTFLINLYLNSCFIIYTG